MTQMRHGAFLATIDLTEFGFAARAASSIPLTDARLRQRCFLFRKSHRDYGERLLANADDRRPALLAGRIQGSGQWRPHGVNL